MNTYYSYHSYHLAGKLYGTLGCALAWGIFGAGWWVLPLAAVLICLWLPVILGRPHFLTVTSVFIAWGNGITRRQIPWEAIESIGYTPNQENKMDSKLSWTQVETGSAITWKYPSCILSGDNSTAEFYSVAVSNNHQQADTGTKMIHL